jgi:DNA polymerase V
MPHAAKLFGIADCNNFYASCERAFQPKYENCPVFVLSNNDGCVIAMCNQCKAIGIKMGTPFFMLKEEIAKYKIKVFSSNYTLYGDTSNRVMCCIGMFVPEYEQYSIDEIFFDLTPFQQHYDILEYCKEIKYTVRRNTRIPISIGVAPTKTLAKAANKLAKKRYKDVGVFILNDQYEVRDQLKDFAVGDIWGIGRQHEKLLKLHGFDTAVKLMDAPDAWVRKNLSVVGLRLVNELRGVSCLALEEIAPKKQNMCVSRSFGGMLEDLHTIEESLTTHANRASEKLRNEGSNCESVTVFLHTNQFREDLSQYSASKTVSLPFPTNDGANIIRAAHEALKLIYKQGYRYKKCGIFVNDLTPASDVQLNMFVEEDTGKKQRLNKALDLMNAKYGKGSLKYAIQGTKNEWKLRAENLSPSYTTKLSDIPIVNLDAA